MLTELVFFVTSHFGMIMYAIGGVLLIWTIAIIIISFIRHKSEGQLLQMPFSFLIKHPFFVCILCCYGYFSFENSVLRNMQNHIEKLYKITQVSEDKIKKIEDTIHGPSGINERVKKLEELAAAQKNKKITPKAANQLTQEMNEQRSLLQAQKNQVKKLIDSSINKEMIHMSQVSVGLLQGHIRDNPMLNNIMNKIAQKNLAAIKNSVVLWTILQFLWNQKHDLGGGTPQSTVSWGTFFSLNKPAVSEDELDQRMQTIIADEYKKDCLKFARTLTRAWNFLRDLNLSGIEIERHKSALLELYINNIMAIVDEA